MGWGSIGLSWARYANRKPSRNCRRCHLDYAEGEDSCPHCGHLNDHELQLFLRELKEKRIRNNNVFIICIAALLFYVIFVLFLLPLFLE